MTCVALHEVSCRGCENRQVTVAMHSYDCSMCDFQAIDQVATNYSTLLGLTGQGGHM